MFFTQVVGLSAAQVGLGLTLAGVVTLFCAIPLGRLTDRVGAKRLWALTALAQAAFYRAVSGGRGNARKGLFNLSALRNPAFLARSACGGVLGTNQVLLTHDTVGWVTIGLVWVGHITVTGAELYQSAGSWGLVAELSDPARLGEYQGAAQLGSTAGSVWAPAAYTFLAIHWGTPGWLLIAVIVVLATVGIHPAARADPTS